MPVTPPRPCPEGKVAIIDVDGLLLNMDMVGLFSAGENPVAIFREKLDQVRADPCVRAVVVRINSRGGGVTATDIMWRDLRAFKEQTGLPVVACLMDAATGGGYYLATAADQIVAHPTTITGGIGVIFNLYNLQDAMAQQNILATPVKAGPLIDLGTPIAPPSEPGRQILQQIADDLHARFCDIVRQARPQVDPGRRELFDGRILTAPQALGAHLVDTIGYLDDAVAIARQLGGAPAAQVVMLHRCNDRARTPYAIMPNEPYREHLLPVSIPGYDRSKLPTFLYLWQADPTIEP
jgi:protease-4